MAALEPVPICVRPGRFSDHLEQQPLNLFRIEAKLRLQPGSIESAAYAIMITDRAGVIAWVNRAFTALTGFTFEDAIGVNPKRLINSGEQDASFYRQLWATILRGRVWRGKIINQRKDGSLYVEAQCITPIKDSAGNITHFVAVKRDLTAHESAAALPLPEEEPGLKAIGLETILVVGDDAERRTLDTSALRAAGYRLLVAADQASALALLDSHRGRLDLLFTNAVTGPAIADAVLEARRDIDVLYASSSTAQRLLRRASSDHFPYVIRKPYASLALLQKVRDVLDLRRCTKVA